MVQNVRLLENLGPASHVFEFEIVITFCREKNCYTSVVKIVICVSTIYFDFSMKLNCYATS